MGGVERLKIVFYQFDRTTGESLLLRLCDLLRNQGILGKGDRPVSGIGVESLEVDEKEHKIIMIVNGWEMELQGMGCAIFCYSGEPYVFSYGFLCCVVNPQTGEVLLDTKKQIERFERYS